ncbi:hypothetical protein AADZ90_021350 [Aestuariibius sp. 2305UL40-4]|uniref:hypothetical protein n=1 Tax=Aestuariibius violaceus TaxID=3234132 RepID=UPI00345E75A1
MLLKLNRSQKTELGLLRSGVAYKFDPRDPRHDEVAERLLEKKFAEKTTNKKLAAEAVELEAQAAEGEGNEGEGEGDGTGGDGGSSQEPDGQGSEPTE